MKSQRPTARLVKAICRNETVRISNVINPTGGHTKSPLETINCLLDTLSPGSRKADDTMMAGKTCDYSKMPEENELIAHICSLDQMKVAINEFQPFKTPGPDGIYPVLLQKGWDYIKRYYHILFQACLKYSYVPLAMEEGYWCIPT